MIFRQVGVDHQTISTIYSVRAASTVVSSLLVGYLFDTDIFRSGDGKGSQRKLTLLSVCHAIIAMCLFFIPFITSFPLLLSGMVISHFNKIY